jgi:hypothetical protein
MHRSARGHAFIEFVISATVIVPVMLLLIDSFLIVSATELNDGACKEAARLASSGDPRLAEARAYQIVSQRLTSDQQTYSLHLVAATTSITDSEMNALLPYGGSLSGTVDVTTEIEVKPFILCWFLGGPRFLHLRANQVVPITYVIPNACQSMLALPILNTSGKQP